MIRLERDTESVTIRELSSLDGDIAAFVFDSWIESARGSGMCRRMPRFEYDRVHAPLVRELASRCAFLLAQVEGDGEPIFAGWMACEPSERLVHYVYTKGAFRRLGIATQLVEAFGRRMTERCLPRLLGERVRHTHMPSEANRGFREICDWFDTMGWVYRPHAMWRSGRSGLDAGQEG